MADTYRPPPRNGGGRRHTNDDPPYRANSPPRRGDDSGYSFRGAAGGDSYRPAQFTFNAPGPQARFPDVQPPARKKPGKGFNGRQQNKPHQGGRPGWQNKPFFKPRAAHDRAILKHVDDDTTTEQMTGMNGDNQPKFAEYISSSEDESESDDSSDEDENDGESRKKRVKTDKADGDEKPKWSNPDPYSVLPPPDAVAGPKKDIVQTIRKAKVETAAQAAGTNAVKENADFISFDFGENADDDDEDDDGQHSVGEPPAPASTDYVMPTDQELLDRFNSTQNMKGNKRKRGVEEATSLGDIVEEWLPNHTNPTPWLQPDPAFTSSVGLKLHKEILDFYDYVRPHRHEEELRDGIIDRLQRDLKYYRQAGQSVGNIEIRSFGSFPAGLYLPTADMDLVALSSDYLDHGQKSLCQNRKHMWKMSDHFNRSTLPAPGSVAPVIGAKVPLVKFVDGHTGIKVDLSFENDSGLHANKTFQGWKEEFPEMPVLVMIIKQLLAMRGLNEVHTGGIGGFTIICLVVSMLQLMPESVRNGMDFNARYGELLLNFLDLYGNKFSLMNTGIQMKPPGYFNKNDRPSIGKAKLGRLMIIDPNRNDNDISGGSTYANKVFETFSGARAAIQRRLNQVRAGQAGDGSILGCVLGGNYSSFREQRDRLDRIDRQDAARDQPQPQSYRQPPPVQQYYNGMYERAPSPRRGQAYDRWHNDYSFQPLPQQYSQYQQYPPPHGLPARPALAPHRAPEPANNGPAGKKQKQKNKPKPKKVKPVEAGPSTAKEKKQKAKTKKKSNKKESNKKTTGKKAAKNAK
ncbi:Poly(A) RNA polymerase cid14 [Fulvia fulva]|uniref:polynucleotide adenylyltransferase n=1 Tax=Passalora fulva TaxID=5499 RepID=A0A9Q8PC57_PASFU|nr:Poly(A) RNA polymerase cid14 [Fulvia fulva]UJO19726.1 Poly(A) RNA polymerase cid14 [Fulvia fulva]